MDQGTESTELGRRMNSVTLTIVSILVKEDNCRHTRWVVTRPGTVVKDKLWMTLSPIPVRSKDRLLEDAEEKLLLFIMKKGNLVRSIGLVGEVNAIIDILTAGHDGAEVTLP